MKDEFRQELNKILSELTERIKTIRGHKLSLGFLENIEVSIYGSKFLLKSLCLIVQLDPLTFRLDPFDPNSLKEIEKSIEQRKLSLIITREKNSLIVRFPELTEEMKKEIFKSLNSLKEEVRIKARLVRDEYLKKLKSKKDEMSEDAFYRTKEDLDKEVDNFNHKVEEIFSSKEKEILG
ncbi:MAG: ribosome-recycling factor [Candidatus Parcubacteria bacterium]|nr:MAG: ribosome-recycling factor [Candidatus Parcubacteria bacterium]